MSEEHMRLRSVTFIIASTYRKAVTLLSKFPAIEDVFSVDGIFCLPKKYPMTNNIRWNSSLARIYISGIHYLR